MDGITRRSPNGSQRVVINRQRGRDGQAADDDRHAADDDVCHRAHEGEERERLEVGQVNVVRVHRFPLHLSRNHETREPTTRMTITMTSQGGIALYFVSPWVVSCCCCSAAAPIRPPMPIDSTALLGISISAPFSFSPSYSMFIARRCSAVG